MSNFTLTGKIHHIKDVEQITDTFKKREFVLSVEDGPHTELIQFEMVQDGVDIIHPYSKNQDVTVHFNVKGREWQGRYFVSLRAWRIEAVT